MNNIRIDNLIHTISSLSWPYLLLIVIVLSISLFIYRKIDKRYRELFWDRIFPALFFLALAIKVILKTIERGGRKKTFLLYLDLINSTLALLFMLMTVLAYIIRSKAIQRAQGFWERLFPLLVVGCHLTGTYFLVQYTKFNYVPQVYITGLIISILGVVIDVIAMWQIRKSFSIMVEVRELVTSGIYRYIRHPLYFGEIIHVGGIALLFNNMWAYAFFFLVCIVQTARAILEEKKLMLNNNNYTTYKKKAGFFLPIVRRKG
ncbi:MAG: methyltransferase family protein [bacterium]